MKKDKPMTSRFKLLTFQHAGEVTMQVPVANPGENQGPTGE